jgi:hypothetical protein
MTKLQAAMKDKSAKTWPERKQMYKVGSPMKGCLHCGNTEEDENGRVRYTSGFQVFRSYMPQWTKWTWKCWECGSTDLSCWAADDLGLVEAQLGKEPVIKPKDQMAKYRYALRKEAMLKMEGPAVPKSPTKSAEIARLQKDLAQLMELAAKLVRK